MKYKKPRIRCSVNIQVSSGLDNQDEILLGLISMGFSDVKHIIPKFSTNVLFEFAIVDYMECWHLNDALNVMFLKITPNFENLKKYIKKIACEVIIDIAFSHDLLFPSLEISKENIEKIYDLNASISIDAH